MPVPSTAELTTTATKTMQKVLAKATAAYPSSDTVLAAPPAGSGSNR